MSLFQLAERFYELEDDLERAEGNVSSLEYELNDMTRDLADCQAERDADDEREDN